MAKVGRNQPCPCGSGKKFKKCCNNISFVRMDAASVLHIRCIDESHFDSANIEVNFLALLEEFFETKNNHDLEFNDSFYEEYASFVEQKIIDLCASYSSYELLFWLSRINPINRYGSTLETAYVYHDLMKIAMSHFGTKKEVFVKRIIGEMEYVCPSYIDGLDVASCEIPIQVIDVLSAIYRIEAYCYYYIYLKNGHRVYIKGGVPRKNSVMGLRVDVSDEVSYLINMYDKRQTFQTLLSRVGSYSFDVDSQSDDFKLFFLSYNFENKKHEFLKNMVLMGGGATNYTLNYVDIEQYYKLLKEINPVFFVKLGFQVEYILSILFYFSFDTLKKMHHLISDSDVSKLELSSAMILLQRGYTLLHDVEDERRGLIGLFVDVFKVKFPEFGEPSIKSMLSAYQYLFLSYGNFESLEYECMKGYLFRKVAKDKIVVDLTGFITVLIGFVSHLKSIDGDLANVISRDFEDKVSAEVKHIFGDDSIFIRGVVSSSSGNKKEIDCSFIYKEYLFVIECKSLSVSDGSVLGSKSAIEFRKNKILSYIRESESKADFLINHSGKLSKEIPVCVKYVVPIVSTSFPEFIWDNSEDLFLSNNLPRVITPEEIKLIRDGDFQDLLNRSYVRKVGA
ncbi:hypothetical protein DSECCO2_397680 [anaerobic digester metagenome]